MTVRLRNEDRRAVDLLLDRAASGTGISPPGAGDGNSDGNSNGQAPSAFTPVDRAVQARLPAAQKLLQMLDMLPAEEPAQDLLPRTLRRVDSEMAKHPSTLRPPQPTPGAPMHHPHA